MSKRIFAPLAVLFLTASSAPAAPLPTTLSGKLALGPVIAPGIQFVQIFIKSDAPFGFAGAEFDIVSEGTGHMNYGSGTPSMSTTFSFPVASDGYLTIKPQFNIDGSANASQWRPQPVDGATPDGDFDVISMVVASVPGTVDSNPANESVLGLTGDYELVATQRWTISNLNAQDALDLYFNFPTYFTDTTGGTDSPPAPYDNVVGYRLVLIPEPATVILSGIGGVSLLALNRRRRS